jgi:hypothetical protein
MILPDIPKRSRAGEFTQVSENSLIVNEMCATKPFQAADHYEILACFVSFPVAVPLSTRGSFSLVDAALVKFLMIVTGPGP